MSGGINSVIPMSGYTLAPSEFVDFEARLPVNGARQPLPPYTSAQTDATSAFTWFGSSLYHWDTLLTVPSSAWEPGAAGHHTEVRGRRRSGGYTLHTFDTSSTDTQQCLFGSSDWNDFIQQCTSRDDGALRLETFDFVPHVTVGRTGCAHTTEEACSSCGLNLPATGPSSPGELFQPNIDLEYPDSGYRLHSGSMFATGAADHTQGVARLRDLIVQYNGDGTQDRVGRVIHTDNAFDSGLTYYEQPVTTGTCAIYDTIYYTADDPDRVYRQNIRGDYGHPSGVQAHGDYVVVAMEDYGINTASDSSAWDVDLPPSATPQHGGAAVYFLHYAPTLGAVGTLANYLLLDGSQGEPEQSGATRASAAAFVQLADHHFLLAVAGSDNIWFYYSDRDTINMETQWRFLSFWSPDDTTDPYEPDCVTDDDGNNLNACYGKAAGMALLTDCTGAIYLWTADGSSSGGADYQWWQVFRLLQHSSGAIQLFQNSWQRDYTGTLQINNPAFRWAGGAYISALQRPVLFNTERKTNEGSNSHIDGQMYYRLSCPAARASSGTGLPVERPPIADPDSEAGERVPVDMLQGGTPMMDQRVLEERR